MPFNRSHFAAGLTAALACTTAAGCTTLPQAAAVATGFASHQLCSAVFVSGQDPKTAYDQVVAPNLGPAGPLMSHSVDLVHREVVAKLAGLSQARAVYRGSQGCLVVRGDGPAPAAIDPAPDPQAPRLAPIAGPDVVAPATPALAGVLDRAFTEPTAGPHRWTKAVVIVHDGRIVAERYAPGYGMATPEIGWSVSKSVVNALIGVLAREGRLNTAAPAPIAAWSAPGDPHHAISIDNLLRMTSGTDFGQSLEAGAAAAFDPTARMMFATDDMAGYAQSAPVKAPPGRLWTYSNGNTLLLSRIVRDQAGGDAASTLAFARRELFDKLGMEHVVMEFDGVGTPIGSSHIFASARDWARFGLLYLNDGVVGGERILPEGWVDYSARFTPGSEGFSYGAGFWTNRGTDRAAAARVAAGFPADSFMARGSYGQAIVIAPAEHLVIVRLGVSYGPMSDAADIAQLTRETVAALR
ncbi:MAG TPA: serine hydrolase [Caulobacteraceae bacterium]|jgi:hypothetical protein